MIEVTQSARDAAADLLGGACPDGVREGKQDSLSVVQAFAAAEQRGMIAERARTVAWLEDWITRTMGQDISPGYLLDIIATMPMTAGGEDA